MDKLQLQLGQKVKMSLEQPYFKCSGRDDVTCRYRGVVTEIYGPGFDWIAIIKFKYKGELIEAKYDIIDAEFIDKELKDIKLVSN